jgi:hypothetical protein
MSSSKRLLLCIPGFGLPKLDQKLAMLKSNLALIQATKPDSLHINLKMFFYSVKEYTAEWFEDLPGIDHKDIQVEAGVIGQFMYKYVTPDSVSEYDYIMFLMDDILLPDNFDISQFITIYDNNGLDIISPSLSTASARVVHKIMKNVPENVKKNTPLRVTTFCEFFCYLMTKESYTKYYAFLDERSKWLWGVDVVLYTNGMTMGILDSYAMRHTFLGGSNSSEARCEAQHVCQKFKSSRNEHVLETRSIETNG